MKTDLQLKADVAAELAWDPAINETRVGVAVRNGVVTLAGQVDSYLQKHAIERAVRRVAGVRGIALDLAVTLAAGAQRSDADIAQAALVALEWHALVPHENLKVEVEDGWVTLTGEVDSAHQSMQAERCIRPLLGVRGVANRIEVRARADATVIRDQIAAALARHAQREARQIVIEVEDGVVTLTGRVDSLADHDAAIGTAYAAKGVTRVLDRLEVVA
ncbi:MAG: BON domain-containing protein [Burkholderiales bacterium]|nr:BON domain-containing protein [Burkholderiales bacterium]